MEDALLEIIDALRAGERTLDDAWLDKLVRRHNRAAHDARRTVAKRRLLPYYLNVRANDPERWHSWGIDSATEERLLRLLKLKPRRTASGVATVTVLTKPWPCSSDCLYCPNDVRMPKSYLANEPACQRAERNCFDPYLQVKARLHVLRDMGHVVDKVELIVLGGSWNDYPASYQRWFVRELFRALNDEGGYEGGPELAAPGGPELTATGSLPVPEDNDALEPSLFDVSDGALEAPQDDPAHDDPAQHSVAERTAFYASCGLSHNAMELERAAASAQARVTAGEQSYNQAIAELLGSTAWERASSIQRASWEEVEAEQRRNERAQSRVVGLVIETRPDLITAESARTMRRLGCTKIQMGIQSLDENVLALNKRQVNIAQIARAFAVLRRFGFKIHIHFMVNLLGSSPEADKDDYLRLVSDPRFCPDEVKLYPCALVESSRLTRAFEDGSWRPYSRDELLDVLVFDVLATPSYVRISRMIRDIPSTDIVAGSKRTNLRQMVEGRLEGRRDEVREIRMREVATRDVGLDALRLDCVSYATVATEERFLQWVGPEGEIAGFCRLSLPDETATHKMLGGFELPLPPATAMIREVHVYGRVAGLGVSERGAAQHAGLGRALVEEACRIAREHGFAQVAVISAVGTRPYYRKLGFEDAGLYQLRRL